MRVSAIQAYRVNGQLKSAKNRKLREDLPPVINNNQTDTVSFKGKAVAGATIGGILGAAAISILSGGAAIPLVLGAYTIGGAAVGAGVGEAFNDDKDNDNKKED